MVRLFIKKWVFLFIIIVFDLIIGLRVSLEFFFFFLWFLLFLMSISLLWLMVEYFGGKLHLSREMISKVVEGDILHIETEIKNRGFFPLFNLVIEDKLSPALPQEGNKWILSEYLGTGSFIRLEYSCICHQRGKYRIGPFAVYFFDPFNLLFLKKVYYIYSELYVYPKTFNIHEFFPLTKGILPWFGIDTTRVSGDEDEFFGVREYKEGDPLKKIHWISTARKNKLMVKEFQRLSFFRATIIFNLEKDKNFGEGKESVSEYTIKIAASLARYLTERDVSLEVIAHAEEMVHIPFNKGSEHLEDILKFLAIARSESRVNLGEIIEEFSRYISCNDSNLIIIMPDEDWKYMPRILSLQKKNIPLIPLILIASTFLYPSESQTITKEIKMQLSQSFDFYTQFFSCGDNLEGAFIKH